MIVMREIQLRLAAGGLVRTGFSSLGRIVATTEVVYFDHQKARVLDIANGLIEHSGEHYGQLVVYYRLAGLVPPESRPKK